MLQISPDDIAARLRADNPWWQRQINRTETPHNLPRRDYYEPLRGLIVNPVSRAVIVLGARRVGKTTLIRQIIGDEFIRKHFPAILFASIDTPIYAGLSLDRLLTVFEEQCPHEASGRRLVVFDEIQYLKDWERHLKDLVDRFPQTKFVASGSAGAALKRKSDESGAGRFTDFALPPLTFAEFIRFRGQKKRLADRMIKLLKRRKKPRHGAIPGIGSLNEQFIAYVNFGGYPEAVFGSAVQEDFVRFIGRDIVDKVLLRDLPSLYGIQDIQELNRLFAVLCYNTGQEVSLEALSSNSGVAKNTIQRYLDYLEAAFLIHRVRRVDDNAQRFRRQRTIKVYLANPSMRTALFGPVSGDDPAFGAMAETAALCQWSHSPDFANLHFARWDDGEVDIVCLAPSTQRPEWAFEVKWSDHHAGTRLSGDLAGLIEFAKKNGLKNVNASTATILARSVVGGVTVYLEPLATYCYRIGLLTAATNLQTAASELRAAAQVFGEAVDQGTQPDAKGPTRSN